MKKLLVFFWLFSISFKVLATEQRLTAIHPSNPSISWDENKDRFPIVLENLERKGTLTQTRVRAIESIHPYDTEAGRTVARPFQLDDLVYESLMLVDPVSPSEAMYPLIAQALRIADDMSYVVFEIHPQARFQDGAAVTGDDVIYSLDVYKDSGREHRAKIDAVVQSTSSTATEVRFNLKTTGFASRRAIMQLAALKIVKPNTTGATEIGGIRVRFTPTGPYRLTQLGRARLSLIIDPAYWGRGLSTRRGFFNFRAIEIVTYADEMAARQSMVNDTANFLFESQPGAAAATLALLIQKNASIKHVEQASDTYGKRLPVLSFNTQNPAVQDWRVRQGILLAYDFEHINQMNYAGTLQRPLSLFQDGPLSPNGEPAPKVRALMEQCSAPAEAPFESHGHAQYAQITDKRIRLLTAMRLFQEAGLKVENGVLKRPLPDGNFVPVHLRLLVRDAELRAAQSFRSDLLRLGILVQVSSAEGDAFRIMRQTKEFDLVSGFEAFLDKEGRPSVSRFESRAASTMPCLNEMLRTLETSDPEGESHREVAEALVRVHQALSLSIFTGSPAKKNFFYDARLNLPGPEPKPEKMHLYGYWLDPQPPGVPFNGYYLPGYGSFGGCYDIGCLFGGMR